MKRSAVLVALMLWFVADSTPALAQIKAFLHVAVTGSTFRGGSLEDASPIYRFGGGGGLRYVYPSGMEFETGVDYVVKGGELRGTLEDIPIVGISEITYVSLPMLVGYRLQTSGRVQPRVVFGPSMSFKTDARITYRAVGGDIEQSNTDDGIQKRDLGWVFGVDANTRLGSETLTTGLRITLGNSNARTADPEVLHTTFGFYTGIVF
ncbi:MAG: outer membrane beta-barrel protein [Bacteroidetes bacterium]|nr:outer membrane beta-barrel protein [Bacteroidota bacterium]MDA0873777.1 outer membrane beta-barrel protein [Bacteroidota bacterium]